MPVKIVEETVEREVKMMTDASAEFVSLVKHGASRMPFRVIKSQKGGTAKTMPMIVQSILLPKTSKLEEVSALKGNEWLAEAVAEKSQDFDDYTKLTQVDVTKFDASSMKMMTLPGGAMALVGQLAEGIDPKGMLTVSEQVVKDNPMDNPLDTPLDAAVATVTEEAPQPFSYDVTFRDLLWREMDGLNSVIIGTLQQAGADPKKRKAAILNAVDAFRNFMSMGLDNISTAAIKMERGGENQEGEEDMFKDKAEFAAAVGAVVDEKLTAFKEEFTSKAAKPDPEDLKDQGVDESSEDASGKKKKDESNIATMIGTAIKEALSPLATKVEALAVKQEEIGSQLVTQKAEEEDPEETVVKKEEGDGDKPKESVFSGLLSGKALTKRGLNTILGN